jgi:hypothetical protein
MHDQSLTQEDYQSVLHVGDGLREAGWPQAYLLPAMVGTWESLIDEIRDRYDRPDEYLDDLSCRRIRTTSIPNRQQRSQTAQRPPLDARSAA